MKKVLYIITAVVIFTLTSCSSSMDRCIQDLIDKGYSYEEAKSECEYARTEAQIRR